MFFFLLSARERKPDPGPYHEEIKSRRKMRRAVLTVVNYKEIMSARFLIIYISDRLFFVLKFILIKRGSFSMICMEKRMENAGKSQQFKT